MGGMDPLHFSGGFSHSFPQPLCADVWKQYAWQDGGKVSREELIEKIAEAEVDIAGELTYWPAPVWIAGEQTEFPRPQRTDLYATSGLNARLRAKSVRTQWGYVLYGGVRATEELGEATCSFLDLDGDGFPETAQFQLTVSASLSICEVQAFFKQYDDPDAANCRTDPTSEGADPAWRVHSLRSTLSGTTLTMYIPAWNLFRPQLSEGWNIDDIDADQAANYVDALEFYRVYNDPSQQVRFLWGEDITCDDSETCAWALQDGCLRVKDARRGMIVPSPGTYDASDETYSANTWSQSREPDYVRTWYRAGLQPRRPLGTITHGGSVACDQLSHFWAETIAILAIARLDRPICDECSNIGLVADRWQIDLAKVGERSFQVGGDTLDNPFGTRAGEVFAWKRLKGRARKRGKAILV